MTDTKYDYNLCPACRSKVVFVFVHGHYQCPVCHQIVVACCEGSGYESNSEVIMEKNINEKEESGIQLRIEFKK